MVPISSDSQDVTGQTVNYFFPVLKDAEFFVSNALKNGQLWLSVHFYTKLPATLIDTRGYVV
jgi:hypothetical protein